MSELPGRAAQKPSPDRLRGGEAVRLHITVVMGVALCAAAFWFELRRAEGGNSLSWAYVFEWPLLAGFAIYMWWKFLHPNRVSAKARAKPAGPEVAPEYEGMLEAWREHQRDLSARQNAHDAELGGAPGVQE